jgi:hypothetical protein
MGGQVATTEAMKIQGKASSSDFTRPAHFGGCCSAGVPTHGSPLVWCAANNGTCAARFLSPNGATYQSPGQRPGSSNPQQLQALKGRTTYFLGLQFKPLARTLNPSLRPGLRYFAPLGLSVSCNPCDALHWIPNARVGTPAPQRLPIANFEMRH